MFYIKSTHPALINIDKDYLLDNEISKALLTNQNSIIKYYPLEKNIGGRTSIPHILKINVNVIKNCNEYSVIKYPNDHTEIILKPFLLSSPTLAEKTSHKIENSKKTLEIHNQISAKISIKEDQNYQYFSYPQPLSYVVATEVDNVCHILLKSTNYVYIQISGEKISIFDDIKKVAFDKNIFSGILPNYDMAKSGKAIEIHFSKPYSYTSKEIYINNKPTLISNPKLIPYAFLEAVRAKNYKLARYYMSQEMQEKLNDATLKNFFENIISISHDIYNDKVCTISQENDIFVATDYDFNIKNGKINDIIQL